MWLFNAGHPCCCASPVIIIAIYDESHPSYDDEETWNLDLENWHDYVDRTAALIRAGIIIPQTSLDDVTFQGELPHDSEREEIDHIVLPDQSPRVQQADIVDFFETIRTRIDDPEEIRPINPRRLLFVLDDSGSIRVEQYEDELIAAKAELQAAYPNMKILDDIITGLEERWLAATRITSQRKICRC